MKLRYQLVTAKLATLIAQNTFRTMSLPGQKAFTEGPFCMHQLLFCQLPQMQFLPV